MAAENVQEKKPKFSWKRLSTSITREMYRRAVEASKITGLTPKKTKALMVKIGEWALGPLLGKGLSRVVGRRARKALGLGDQP